jgi:hypothetical protein
MKTLYKLLFCLFLSLFSISCSKWIDVKPSDRLSEDQQFVNKEGYLKALNGVYVEMTNKVSYGQEMTAGALDVMAGYYFMSISTHSYFQFVTFSYTGDKPKATFDAAWSKAYQLIANCNVILEKCGDAPSQALPEPYYGIIKGETLALRAMLHLDMLRLFGPIYTEANKTKPVLPYVNKTGFEVSPLLSSEQFMQQVTDDLKMALSLMATTDPIRTEGVRNGNNNSGSNDLYYRQYRLNYYAAKALLARAYLWQAKTTDAYATAVELLQEVQTPGKVRFPYVTAANATSATLPDRVFSTEVMFSLYDINRKNMYERVFDVNLNANTKLAFDSGNGVMNRVISIFPNENDYRRRCWQIVSSGTVSGLTNLKYQDVVNTTGATPVSGPGRYMIPLIRLTEVVLIAAECSPDLNTGIGHLNEVKRNRNTPNANPTSTAGLKTEITNEFIREFIGEGQLFFFYKRNGATEILNQAVVNGGNKPMVLNNYVVPLPDSEISQRN